MIGQARLDILTPNVSKTIEPIDSVPALEAQRNSLDDAHLEFMHADKNQAENLQKRNDPSPTDCFDSLRPVHQE